MSYIHHLLTRTVSRTHFTRNAVLFDTLMEQVEDVEILAILGHELVRQCW